MEDKKVQQILTEVYQKLMDIAEPIDCFGLCFYEIDFNNIFKDYGVKIDD